MIRVGQPPYLECSSQGDKRFSAFCAMIGQESIESRYQGAKVLADGRTNLHWRKAKGMPAVNADAVALLYKHLWKIYLDLNPMLWLVLHEATGLSDMFGKKGHVCQAITLWELREESLKEEL